MPRPIPPSSLFLSSDPNRRLHVTVMGASNLRVPKCNSYVTIRANGVKKNTKVVKNSSNPEWKEKLVFPVKEVNEVMCAWNLAEAVV